jgi:hypothetical protein
MHNHHESKITCWRHLLLGALLASATYPRVAAADQRENEQDANYLVQNLDVWEKTATGWHLVNKDNRGTLEGCKMQLEALTKHHAPESITIDLPFETPLLKPGVYPWTKARELCDLIRAENKKLEAVKNFKLFLTAAQQDTAEWGRAKGKVYYEQCLEHYKRALAAGVPESELVTDDVTGEQATLKALADSKCKPGFEKLAAEEEARAAPFKKVLKNDKLRIGLRDFDFIYLPGRAKVTPASLAANNVWFEDVSGDARCANGLPQHTLHRYVFDANHKLAKTTDRQFCGEPPSSAFR